MTNEQIERELMLKKIDASLELINLMMEHADDEDESTFYRLANIYRLINGEED